MEYVFFISAVGVVYAYVGYAATLWIGCRVIRSRSPQIDESLTIRPAVSVLLPVHNEVAQIASKVENTLTQAYSGKLELIVVSDGSTDGTDEVVKRFAEQGVILLRQAPRQGKAAALNAALALARNEIVVFTDAGITLAPDAISEIVRPFMDERVGCVSGEDRIAGTSGEGLYGRYELALRRLESKCGSIVGASGSLYAQRRSVSAPFVPGLAPDFLSVLRTLEAGYRAVSTERSVGTMAAVASSSREFERKARTLLRGITTLAAFSHLLNPLRYPRAAFCLASHKLARWCVPFLLILMLIASAVLAPSSAFYRVVFALQLGFYGLAILGAADRWALNAPLVRIPLYFCISNLAVLVAWAKYLGGVRQELWTPSRR
jgi:cellulose synthase/poly-beta-1,6-N-acetylglucosamine synthase-like glycosyltransferase